MPHIELEVNEAGSRALHAALVELNRQALFGQTNALLREAANVVVAMLAVEFCSIWERLADDSMLLRAGAGWNEGRIAAQVERNKSAPAIRAALSQEPVVIDDLSVDSRFLEPSLLSEHGVVSSVHVPIYGPVAIWGVLGAHCAARRSFQPEEINVLQLVAHSISTGFLCRGGEDGAPARWRHAERMMALGEAAAGMAHELRNPLTSIKGLIQVNAKEFEERGLPSDDLQVIEQEIRRMERSLEAFLDFARPPRARLEQVDLGALIGRVKALVQGRAKKQRVSIDIAAPPEPVLAYVDADQIQQLLLNLALNALDALTSGGKMEFVLRRGGGSAVEIEVIDTGPGISAHILPVVFDSFVSDKEAGVGLGLPVSRRIAEEHGGSLTAANLPGGGAAFLLTLPSGGADAYAFDR